MNIFKDYIKKLSIKVTYFWNPGIAINQILKEVIANRQEIILLKREYYNL